MSSRRDFIQSLFGVAIASNIEYPLSKSREKETSVDWEEIRSLFLPNHTGLLNLNHGSASNMPIPIIESHFENIKRFNSHAPYEVLIRNQEKIESQLQRLAQLIGVRDGHLYIIRNTTEGISIALRGYPLQQNDEVITASCDYPYMHYTVDHLVQEKGITNKKIDLGFPIIDDDEIVDRYKNAISDKTKLLILTHITHREGQILPVKRICDMAKKNGVDVIIDGAHAVGHIDLSINDINCDYYISSLHKWSYAPHGTGVIFIKDNHINTTNPPLSYPLDLKNQKKKFEYLGTRSFANLLTLESVLDFLEITGISAKQKRFESLKKYWTDQVKDLSGCKIVTDISRSGGIASITTHPKSSVSVRNALKEKYNIHVKITSYNKEPFIRISPNVSTSYKELDMLVEALKNIL